MFISPGVPVLWHVVCFSEIAMTSQAFGVAYERSCFRTIAFLISRGVPRDQAPDVAQSAWMRGWERLEQLREEKLLLTWVNTIAWNHYRKLLRSRKVEEEVTDLSGGSSEINWAAIDISRLLGCCKPSHRQLLEAQLKGITPQELAEQTGASAAAIRIRFLRARRAARDLLAQRKDAAISALAQAA
jgi:RNA polymerase sigma-70 factor (ECF subfamily)